MGDQAPSDPLPVRHPGLRLAARLFAPTRSEAVISFFDERRQLRLARLDALADAAESESGESFEDLLARAHAGETQSDLAESILQQAGDAASEWKMRALGRALARGLLADDDAEIDELRLMLAAMKDLEAPHVRVLQRLYSDGDRYSGLVDYRLAQMFPNGVRVLYSILKTLERHGLAGPLALDHLDDDRGHDAGPDEPQTWAIWDFGILLVEHLLDVGTAPDG